MQSEQINELAGALSKAQSQMKAAIYNKQNPHFKNWYADLAAVIDAIRKPLADNGLSITQTPEMKGCADGGDIFVLRTTLNHTSGQWISSIYPLPMNVNPQQLGSALTYARRYSLSCIACIAADEDEDAEIASKPSREPISEKQEMELLELCEVVGADRKKFIEYLNVHSLAELPASRFKEAMDALNAKRKAAA